MIDQSIYVDANVVKDDLKIEFKVQGVMTSGSYKFEVTKLRRQATVKTSAKYASCTEAFRKLPLPADLVVWTMPPGFLGARWWGERRDGVLGPRGRGSSEEWKGSTGK